MLLHLFSPLSTDHSDIYKHRGPQILLSNQIWLYFLSVSISYSATGCMRVITSKYYFICFQHLFNFFLISGKVLINISQRKHFCL